MTYLASRLRPISMAFDGFVPSTGTRTGTGRPRLLRNVLRRRRGTLPRHANPSIGRARPSGGSPCELPRSQPSCSPARQRRARRARTIEAFIRSSITAARTSRPPAVTSTRPWEGRARRSPPSRNPLPTKLAQQRAGSRVGVPAPVARRPRPAARRALRRPRRLFLRILVGSSPALVERH